MKAVNELIEMGFDLRVVNENIKMEFKGNIPPSPDILKPLLEELKQNKPGAIQYIQTLVVYEIYEGLNFDSQVQIILNEQFNQNVRWMRLDVYRISRKIVLVGVAINTKFTLNSLQNLKDGSMNIKDCQCPERMVM